MCSLRGADCHIWTVRVLATCFFATTVVAQSPQKSPVRYGEATEDNVYVRSGPSTNHYPVAKLNAADRITVVGETKDWLEVQPPDGTFSFISGDYVDTADDLTGVVNGNNVRVRAGSVLPEFKQLKYVVQTKLSKGAELTILGRDADGFLRIKPPTGVTVWVNRAYVRFVAERLLSPRSPVGTHPAIVEATSEPETTIPDAAELGADIGASEPEDIMELPFRGLRESPQRRTLVELEGLAHAELERPLAERDFGSLIDRYQPVAMQQQDEFAQRYAAARVQQLTHMAATVEAVRSMQQMDEQTESKRREFLDQRAKLREQLPPIPSGLDARGVLRVSALYPPGSFPERYRLVDLSGKRERTVAYIEIRPNSQVDVSPLLGRYVGVRAIDRRLQTGGVRPVPILVVGELVPLDEAKPSSDSVEQG